MGKRMMLNRNGKYGDGFINTLVFCALLSSMVVSVPAWSKDVSNKRLPDTIKILLKAYGISSRHISLYVHRIGEAEPALVWKENKARNPASTIKMLTTMSALEELGPAYRWKTEVYLEKPVQAQVSKGDIYLKGYGDPFLVTEKFWRLLRNVRKQGLNHIGGDLVLDDSYFVVEEQDPGEFDDQPYRSYNAAPSAIMLNFQSVYFRFFPIKDQSQVKIVTDPDVGLDIDNRIRLTKGSCRSNWSKRIKIRMLKERKGTRLRLSGRYAESCGERSYYRVVTDASRYVYGVFQNLWKEQGGYFSGKLKERKVPEAAELFYTNESVALSDVVRSVNKYSNNVMTRQLLLTLGAEKSGPPGTTIKGIDAVKAWLKKKNLNTKRLVLDNGAGLSRDTRISAKQMGQFLLAAYESPYMPEFMSSLPIAAIDGTARNHFKSSHSAGRMHAKTGLLNDVRGLAGYVLDEQNNLWVVVCFQNHRKAHRQVGQRLQQALVDWLYFQNLDEEETAQ